MSKFTLFINLADAFTQSNLRDVGQCEVHGVTREPFTDIIDFCVQTTLNVNLKPLFFFFTLLTKMNGQLV